MSFLNKAVRRLLAPDRARHYLFLPEHDLAYARVPKAANSSIKQSLHDLLFGEQHMVRDVNRDEFWRNLPDDRARLLSAAELMRDAPEAFVFTFTRNPFSRVASCYFDKLILKNRLAATYHWRGFRAGMSFAQFVEKVAGLDDEKINTHLSSQTFILSHDGKLVPQFIGRVETVAKDWRRLTRRLKARGGPHLCRLRIINKTYHKRPSTPELFSDPGLVRLVRERYGADFDNFYPNMDAPVADVATVILARRSAAGAGQSKPGA